MTIPAQCPACFHIFQVDDAHAGQGVQCHNCGTPTLVPKAAPVVDDDEPVEAYVVDEPRFGPGKVEDATVRATHAFFSLTGSWVMDFIFMALCLAALLFGFAMVWLRIKY